MEGCGRLSQVWGWFSWEDNSLKGLPSWAHKDTQGLEYGRFGTCTDKGALTGQASQDSVLSWVCRTSVTSGSGRSKLSLDFRERLRTEGCWPVAGWWEGATFEIRAGRGLCDAQHPSFHHSLFFCTISILLCLFILQFIFCLYKLRAQGKAFSTLSTSSCFGKGKLPDSVTALTNFNRSVFKRYSVG